MQPYTKKRVGILRGGTGRNYAFSLRKGGDIISYIFENLFDEYKPIDILVDKDGIWHLSGLPISPADLMHQVDVVWSTTHPSFSNILDSFSIPNVGVSSFFSTLENNRDILKEHMKNIDVQIPRYLVSPKGVREVFEKFSLPWIVKNSNEIKIVKTFDELAEIINSIDNLIVEEFITGKVASTHSVPNFRGKSVYTFPISNFANLFSNQEKDQLVSLAKSLHAHMGAKHYLKLDFIMNSRGRIFLLNVESHPDLKQGSHFHQVCQSVGVEMHHVLEHMLEMVL